MKQQTPEWLEMRKGKIGASDAPPIMGISPWKSSYQLWEEKVGISQSQHATIQMKRGIELEETARQAFERETGLMMVPQVVEHTKIEYMIASLDGMDFSGKNILEIKCAGKEDHECALAGKVPEKYYPQLQHQIEVCNVEKAFYYSFDGTYGKILEVYRDDKYIEKLLSKEAEFWNFVQNLTAPPLTEKDYVEKNDEFWNSVCEEWKECSRKLHSLKTQEDELRKRLILLAENSNVRGAGVRLSKVVRKGNVDYSSIPELVGVDLEKHRKEKVESWRLTEC